MLKKLVVGALTTGIMLSGAEGIFAAENSNQKIMKEPDIQYAQLIKQTVSFTGEGTADFMYRGTADLRFHLKNNGKSTIYWTLKAPNGTAFQSGSLSSGQQYNYTFGKFDEIPNGRYSVYISNKDGTAGSFDISARSLE
ncbi:hypothetical protein ACE2AI_09775 [Bacillus wiedmannii]|uniref:hypothetical protein n=1 Tax=Bacillus wiedmannii TaxID=1890302 RepID=UPI00065BA54A|nr:hypothetical protein [Bacillus wiedmannii]KMP76705.1 hypothetical protein TU62_06780 [Bacillus cereus]MCQ6546540.1 hypothetical protein [Bacillus wiedmannii]MCQ6571265.1 hypothetical protein [Bacillus wiedmannii]PFX56732.1 hypothetical protein COL36_20500 [Bacillus wiedmannii]WMS84172.1 hypothetical protein RE438_10810 [Bacillus wiedmannii]